MMKTTFVIKMDARDPDIVKLREIARESRDGKIIAFPTETVYGIGAPMSVKDISRELVAIKNREPEKPFSFHIGDTNQLEVLDVVPSPAFRYLTKLFWPGPLTMVVKNRSGESIGIRYPRHRVTASMIAASGAPFVATSANKSGEPSPKTAQEVLSQLEGKIDYLLDCGPCELGEDSTVLDLTQGAPTILRKGAQADAVEKALKTIASGRYPKKQILIVCTGNSCRSPMAEGWLIHELKKQRLSDMIEVYSRGIGARAGMPSTMEAQLVMKNREIDISEHRSKPISREDVQQADLIIAMGPEHVNFIQGLMPQAKQKIRLLNIPDPIGMGMMLYEQVIQGIEKKLKDMWPEVIRIQE